MMIFLFAFWHSSSEKYSEIKLSSTGLSPHLSFVYPVCFFPLTMTYGEQLLVESMLLYSLWVEISPPSLMGRVVPSVIGTCVCSLVCSKVVWLGVIPHSWKQGITQCSTTLPVDAPNCVGCLGLHGEQWDTFQGLDFICPCSEAWSETWAIVLFLGHAGVEITFAKKGLFLSLAGDFYRTWCSIFPARAWSTSLI